MILAATKAAADGTNSVQLLLLVGGITLVPALLFTVTGFTRILVVLGFIRSGLGTPTAPPNQVLVGIAFFLTVFVMAPTFNQIKKDAIDPLTAGKISQTRAIQRGQEPLRTFMFKQTRDSDLALFVRMAHMPPPKTRADIPTYVLIPAFMISELKTAFQIGFLLFIPFVIIDLVVASVLMSMGMMMLSPVLKPRGPIASPVSISSAVGNMFWLYIDGSSVVVTPYAR